jgi:hypothetical protein
MRPLATTRATLARAPSPGVAARARMNLGTLGELAALLWRSGRWWLLPMSLVLAGAAVLLVVVQAVEYVAPFVYTVF